MYYVASDIEKRVRERECESVVGRWENPSVGVHRGGQQVVGQTDRQTDVLYEYNTTTTTARTQSYTAGNSIGLGAGMNGGERDGKTAERSRR